MATPQEEYETLMLKYTRQLLLDSWLADQVARGLRVTIVYVDKDFDPTMKPHYRCEVGILLGTGDSYYGAIEAAKARTDPQSMEDFRARFKQPKPTADWNPEWGDRPIKPGEFPGPTTQGDGDEG